MREAVYVVRRIAAALHMKTEGIHIAEDIAKKLDQLSILRRLIQKGGMQLRLISLEKNWYTMDCGVMMGYYGPKKEVAALLPVWRPARTPPMPPAAASPARRADPEVLPGSVNAKSL